MCFFFLPDLPLLPRSQIILLSARWMLTPDVHRTHRLDSPDTGSLAFARKPHNALLWLTVHRLHEGTKDGGPLYMCLAVRCIT